MFVEILGLASDGIFGDVAVLVIECSGIGSCLVILTDDWSKVVVSVSETILAF